MTLPVDWTDEERREFWAQEDDREGLFDELQRIHDRLVEKAPLDDEVLWRR